MHTVKLFYDTLDSQVQAQIVRDLLVMAGEWEVGVNMQDLPDADQNILAPFLEELGVPKSFGQAELYMVYKTGEDWPQHPSDCPTVERDLAPQASEMTLSGEPHIGYFLKPQGRDGANLTERYLNRSYPKGRGYIDPILIGIWG